MSRFATAFSEGQVAADFAQNARDEIAAVINQLSTDVLTQSQGKIQMAVGESIVETSQLVLVDVAKLGYQESDSIFGLAKQQWLIARNPIVPDSQWFRLVRVNFGAGGYPVDIIYDKVNTRCHDRDALEVALEDLLKSAWCGERLRSLLHREPKSELGYDNMSDVDES